MPPASRRLLQLEVQECYPKPAVSRSGPFSWLRPAWFWGLGCAATAALAVTVFLVVQRPSNSGSELFAKNETQPAVDNLSVAPTAREVPSLAPFRPTSENTPPSTANVDAEAKDSRMPQPTSTAEKLSRPVALARYETASQASASASNSFLRRYGLAPAAPVVAPTSPSPVGALADATRPDSVAQPAGAGAAPVRTESPGQAFGEAALRKAGAAQAVSLSQRFSQAPLTSKAKLGSSLISQTVLNSFQVEQTGETLRIVDEDGSVYTGSVQPVAMPVTRIAPRGSGPDGSALTLSERRRQLASPTPAASLPVQGGQNFYFHVTGTNRSLKQNVVFTGNILELTNPAAPQMAADFLTQKKLQLASEQLRQAQPSSSGQNAPPLLLNSRITGQATVGRDVLEVEALPVSPQRPGQ